MITELDFIIILSHTYITIILSGGYWETNIKKEKRWRGKFYIGFRSADNLHRVDLEPGIKPITLYIAGATGLKKMEEVNTGLGNNFFLVGLSLK